jgi:hypothetical protein
MLSNNIARTRIIKTRRMSMVKQIVKSKVLVIAVLLLAFTVSYSSNAFAWGGHGGRYYWHRDRWYGPGWFGFDVAVSTLAIGALVAGLPAGYTTIVVGGVPYYYYGGYYYRHYPYGYAVVPEPVVTPSVVYAPVSEAAPVAVTQPQGKTTTINIPNSKGSYTPVTLTKHKNGYIGPQGEYYEGHPTVEQLKALYGN